MGEMRTSRRKQRDCFGSTHGGQGSQKLWRGKEGRGRFRRRKAEEEAGCCRSPHAIWTQRWMSRIQNPQKRNEKGKKSWSVEALEWEDSTALISTLQFARWHRHSLSRILIRQSLKLGKANYRGTQQQGLSQAQEKALAHV